MEQGKKREQPATGDDIYPLAVNLTKAARMLNVSRPTLRTRILPLLDWQQVGSRILISVESIRLFLQQSNMPDENKAEEEKE